MTKNRYSDKRLAGSSRLIPQKVGNYEDPMDRHARRLDANLRHGHAVLSSFCEKNGILLEIKNMGHHWMFSHQGKLVEWWPNSAKLVVGKRYHNGIHVHDWEQAKVQVAKEFGIDGY